MTHHPHVHMIVPGGGLSEDGKRWIACRRGFFLPVRVLAKLFRRLMIEKLVAAHVAGKLAFYGDLAHLVDTAALQRYLRPIRRRRWFVYAKQPFAGPRAVLAYLARYTHRVAISNRRLIKADANTVTFRVKDYRRQGKARYTTMTLATHEFIRRFLIHILPRGTHRIRHYGLFANGVRAANLQTMRALLDVAAPGADKNEDDGSEPKDDPSKDPNVLRQPCPCCGGTMRIIETFEAGTRPRLTTEPEGIDSS
jgi:hypothetical protein